MHQSQSITLFFVQGTSSKTYQVQLEPAAGGWVVNYQNGRIGGTLRAGTKTKTPVTYAVAFATYSKLVASKKADGYTESESGVAYTGTENAGRVSGLELMLLNEIDDDEVEQYILDPDWGIECKYDGERRPCVVNDDGIIGVNKKALTVALSQPIHDAIAQGGFMPTTVLDGEDMGESLVVFDVLWFEGRDVRSLPFQERMRVREEVYARSPAFVQVTTVIGAEEKRAFIAQARLSGEEGVCFKRLSAPYLPGGDALKYKFYKDASVRVVGQNGTKHSVGMEMLDENTGMWHFVGNVTIAPKRALPTKGSIIDVRYLYAYPLPGALYQPSFARSRGDLDHSDCKLSQLKYKKGTLTTAA